MGFMESMDKFQEVASKMSENRYLKAVSKGMMMTIPATITGSLLTLLANLPIVPYQAFLTSTNLKSLLLLPGIFTTNIMGLIVVYFVAARLAQAYKIDAMIPGMLALVSFLILTPLSTFDVEMWGSVRPVDFIPFDYIGSKGMFVAIIVGLLVSEVYHWFVKKNITIKMPDSVPKFVEQSFSAIIPFFVITFGVAFISWLFKLTDAGSLHAFIYNSLQVPIQQIGGSIWGILIAYSLIGLFWWLGIHGKALIFGVFAPIISTMTIENMNAVAAGQTPPNMLDIGFTTIFLEIGGGGCVLGLAICFLLFAKSEQYKSVGRVTGLITFFGINEPITFGTPVCLNMNFLIPTVITPLATGLIGYVSILVGFVPRMRGIQLPTGTPTLINGFIVGSWQGLLVQILCVIIAVAIYYPFFKVADNQLYKEEQATLAVNEA